VLGAFRAAWTTPTNLIGHAAATLLGCGRPQRVGGEATRAWLYCLPTGRFRHLTGIAIGHVIILEPALLVPKVAGFWLTNSRIRASTIGLARRICPFTPCCCFWAWWFFSFVPLPNSRDGMPIIHWSGSWFACLSTQLLIHPRRTALSPTESCEHLGWAD